MGVPRAIATSSRHETTHDHLSAHFGIMATFGLILFMPRSP